MPFENDYLAQQARRPFHFKSRRADIQLFLSKEFNSILVWSQMMARHVVLTKHKLGPKVTQFLNVTVNSATVRNRPSGPILRTIRSSTTRDRRERSRQAFTVEKYWKRHVFIRQVFIREFIRYSPVHSVAVDFQTVFPHREGLSGTFPPISAQENVGG